MDILVERNVPSLIPADFDADSRLSIHQGATEYNQLCSLFPFGIGSGDGTSAIFGVRRSDDGARQVDPGREPGGH